MTTNTNWNDGVDEILEELWEEAIILGDSASYVPKLRPEDAKAALTQLHEAAVTAARLDERNMVALDNYRGHTFSADTHYLGKYNRFVESNEDRIAALQPTNYNHHLRPFEGK